MILLVDETKLGQHLSVMVLGLAYRGCCIPLVFWCYRPDAWPDSQVNLIDELLCWVVESIPDGVIPLVQADRGIGTSPDVVHRGCALGWQFLFRVQATTKFRATGDERALRHRVNAPGQPMAAFAPLVARCCPSLEVGHGLSPGLDLDFGNVRRGCAGPESLLHQRPGAHLFPVSVGLPVG